jgi:hypothetical protein
MTSLIYPQSYISCPRRLTVQCENIILNAAFQDDWTASLRYARLPHPGFGRTLTNN